MALVLVIDDHAETLFVVRRIIERKGFRTLGAETAEAALALLATEKPDLIIVDGMMPAMNGVEFIRLARAHEATALTPIILYTAVMDKTFLDNAIEKGANEVWIKGQIDNAQIQERVAHFLS